MILNAGVSRYAFRSLEKVSLQEIGPRFTLKLRWVKKGLPAVKNLGEAPKALEFDVFEEPDAKAESADPAQVVGEEPPPEADDMEIAAPEPPARKVVPPKDDEYQWVWKVSPRSSCLWARAR